MGSTPCSRGTPHSRSVRTVTSNTGPDTSCSLLDTLQKMETWVRAYSYYEFIVSNGFVKVCAKLRAHTGCSNRPRVSGLWPQFPHLTGLCTASSLLPRRRDTKADPLASTGKVALDISTTKILINVNRYLLQIDNCVDISKQKQRDKIYSLLKLSNLKMVKLTFS